MRFCLCGAFAALALVSAPICASAAADDAMTGRINQGSAEVAKSPSSTSGSMPNSIHDPARNSAAPGTSSAVNSGAATAGPQKSGIARLRPLRHGARRRRPAPSSVAAKCRRRPSLLD